MTIHTDPCPVSYLELCRGHRFAPKFVSRGFHSFITILAWKKLGDFISCSFVVVVCQSTEISGKLYENRGGRPSLPVPNKPDGFCGRKAP